MAVNAFKWTDDVFLDDLVLNCLWCGRGFWLLGVKTLPTCAMFWQMFSREKVLGKSKMSLFQYYRTFYLKFPYQSLLSSNQLQLLYTLLFLAGCLFVDLLAIFAELRWCIITLPFVMCSTYWAACTEILQPMKPNKWFKFGEGSQSVACYWNRKSHLCSDQ